MQKVMRMPSASGSAMRQSWACKWTVWLMTLVVVLPAWSKAQDWYDYDGVKMLISADQSWLYAVRFSE